VVVLAPDRSELARIGLSGSHVSVGRLPEANDIALQPDPELLVTRAAHCTLEREGSRWFVLDGGSVNGTLAESEGSQREVELAEARGEELFLPATRRTGDDGAAGRTPSCSSASRRRRSPSASSRARQR